MAIWPEENYQLKERGRAGSCPHENRRELRVRAPWPSGSVAPKTLQKTAPGLHCVRGQGRCFIAFRVEKFDPALTNPSTAEMGI